MKRYLISTVVVLVVLTMAWIAFGQQQSERSERFARYRQAQQKAIKAIQEQVEKLKAGTEETSRRDRGSWQELSEDERTKLRERYSKMREERLKVLAAIEQQVTILKGRRQLEAEHEESIGELQAIRKLAVEEKAEETAKRLMQLILKRNKEFKDNMQKLGLERSGRRS